MSYYSKHAKEYIDSTINVDMKLSYSIATLDIIHLNFVVGFHLIALNI